MRKTILLTIVLFCSVFASAFSEDQLHVFEAPDGSYIVTTYLGKLSMEDMYDTLDKSSAKLTESISSKEHSVEKISKEQEQLILFTLSHYKIEADACYEMLIARQSDESHITTTYALVRIMASDDGRLGWSWWGGLTWQSEE